MDGVDYWENTKARLKEDLPEAERVALETQLEHAIQLRVTRRLRKDRKEDVAQRAGIGLYTVQRYEHGRSKLNIDTFVRLAYALGYRVVLEPLEGEPGDEKAI